MYIEWTLDDIKNAHAIVLRGSAGTMKEGTVPVPPYRPCTQREYNYHLHFSLDRIFQAGQQSSILIDMTVEYRIETDNQGRRVVEGQRLTQAASDIFLGWFTDQGGIDFYVRQLRDMKYAYDPAGVSPVRLANYAQFCGWNLARAHAKSGDAAEITGYLGKSDAFDRAIVSLAGDYAEQNRRDYKMFKTAAQEGRIEATAGF
jgi:hypothetical protein